MRKKIAVIVLSLAMIVGGVILQKSVSANSAFPGSSTELRAQSCLKQSLQSSQNVFDLSCDGTYPSSCGASGDRLSCDDTNYETSQAQRDLYGGINIESNNSQINNCDSIDQVSICYKFWMSSTNQMSCNVGVSDDGGSLWDESSATCLDSEPSSVNCIDVTTNLNWECSNFFGSEGVNARAKIQTIKNGGNPNEIIDLNFDLLFFNVSYTPKDLSVELNSPSDGVTLEDYNAEFNFTPSSSSEIASCSLWDNSTGLWESSVGNQSQILNGSLNSINKTYSSSESYLWNIQCCDGSGFCKFSPLNRTVSFDVKNPPVIESIEVDDSTLTPSNEIDLLPATTKQVNCTSIVSESEGAESLENASSEFFDLSNSFYGDVDDNNHHYSNASCNVDTSYGNSNEARVVCSHEVLYYANEGDWECVVEVWNNQPSSVIGNDSAYVNSLLALGVDSPLNFGELGSEEISDELEANVTNYGNVEINLSLEGYAQTPGDGYAMNCSNGTSPYIPVEFQKYNLFSSVPGELTFEEFKSGYENLTSSPVVKEFNLDYRKNDLFNDAVNNTYWRVYLPRDARGSCQGNIVFGAVQANGN